MAIIVRLLMSIFIIYFMATSLGNIDKFSDKNFDELIKLLDQKRIKKILENNNRDSGIKLITKLAFSEPRLCRYGLKLL